MKPDNLARTETVTDEAGNETRHQYDLFDQTVAIIHPDHVAGSNERIELGAEKNQKKSRKSDGLTVGCSAPQNSDRLLRQKQRPENEREDNL